MKSIAVNLSIVVFGLAAGCQVGDAPDDESDVIEEQPVAEQQPVDTTYGYYCDSGWGLSGPDGTCDWFTVCTTLSCSSASWGCLLSGGNPKLEVETFGPLGCSCLYECEWIPIEDPDCAGPPGAWCEDDSDCCSGICLWMDGYGVCR